MGRMIPYPIRQQEAEQLYTRPVDGRSNFAYPQPLPHQQD